MKTALHTFADIFDTKFDADGEEVLLQKIVIPMIQRDYAQGREGSDISRIRTRFLESLHRAIIDEPITLDFVYGDIKNGIMTPLDGQQRLTTLYLLHWYAAKRDNIPEQQYEFLNRFTYETRYSARHFCISLVKHIPSFKQSISAEIINQFWFPLDWKKDPTIASMLTMLDAIDDTFSDIPNLWEKLKNGAITFYFLPIKDMGLTDELYIKMNSRGKPLTQFEHFKAELERELKVIDEDLAKRIAHKIDIVWTELLWPYRGDDNIIDDEFLRYFKFICDVICYHAGGTPQGRRYDEFDLLKEYFSRSSENVRENAQTLETYFDCWCDLKNEKPSEFLARILSKKHEPGKVTIENRFDIDIFNDCLNNYADSTGRRRAFPLNRIVFLYAITSYLIHRDIVSENQFVRRLRIINNLILNSEDEISDSIYRTSGNRMPAILAQVDNIMISGTIGEEIENNFSPVQLAEEVEKIKWVTMHPDEAERLYALEDHQLLHGQISIVGLENLECFEKFPELFQCKWDKVDCALMVTAFYPQRENSWRYQFGTSSIRHIAAWRNLFHKSRNNIGFEKTKETLIKLLSQLDQITNDTLDEIVTTYVSECENKNEFPFQYYYVKYPEFRPGSYGKYAFSTHEPVGQRYVVSVMQTETKFSEYTYVPYFKIVDKDHLTKDDHGQKLVYPEAYIICRYNSYEVKKNGTDQVIDTIPIKQNNKIDIEDRVLCLKQYLESSPEILYKAPDGIEGNT